ncbi:topoisomerase C-terminal repeat-containing protein [Paraburkholderia sp. GAS32]|uniref:topoisomerase C-terminal repeat-containing protein n=1 Tax=Paraburkholderia sp. GAS32 TaxID=3035129 RepID=UPI003D1A4913
MSELDHGNSELSQEEMDELEAELNDNQGALSDAGRSSLQTGPGDVGEVSADPDQVSVLKHPCPACGGTIVVGERAFESQCGWKAWRSLFTHEITVDEMEEILRDGKSRVITDFESPKTGNEFWARLKLAVVDPDNDGEPPKRTLELEFVDRPQESVGKCPKCSGNVVHRGKHYFCEHNNIKDAEGNAVKPKCDFVLWGEMGEKKLPESAIKALLEGKVTKVLKGFKSKSTGNEFEAALELKGGKVGYVFQQKQQKKSGKGKGGSDRSRFDEE